MMRGKREKKKKGNSTLWAALLVALFVAVSFNISILHLSEWGGDSSTSRWWPGNRMRAAKVDTAQASLTESSPHVVVIAPSPENNASSSSHEDAVWAEPPNAGMESTGHAMGKAEDLSKQTAKAEEGEGEGGDDDDGERQGPDSGIQTREKGAQTIADGGTVADPLTVERWHDDDRGELARPGMVGWDMSQRSTGRISNITWRDQSMTDPWPFYRIGTEEGTGKRGWPWPGVGWLNRRKGALGFDELGSTIKFYMYDEAPFNMEAAEQCYRAMYSFGAGYNDPDGHNLDRNVRLMQREHFAELWLLGALRRHPQRTHVPSEAGLFFIGYAPCLGKFAHPCEGVPPKDEWEDRVADALAASEHFKRYGGADHFFINMKYSISMSKKLQALMDSGPVALTIDRDYWLLIKFMRRTYERGSVLIMPYVSSTFLDVASPSPLRGAEKDAKSWYFFRGTLKRKNGGQSRPMLKELGALLQDADFEGVKLNKKDGSIFTILNETSVRMRSSSVCVCPEGDSPTSLRVFEAIAAGCVPLIMVDRVAISANLPFPSIIDWDEIALFTHSLGRVAGHEGGLRRMAESIESVVGRTAGEAAVRRMDAMRSAGRRVFDQYFSYLRNPTGVADAMLFEAWAQVQRKGVREGPYFNVKGSKRRKERTAEKQQPRRGSQRDDVRQGGRSKM